jgi:hypothetical protein
MTELTYEQKGTPIAKIVIPHKQNKIVSIYDSTSLENKKNVAKKCCKKCKGGSCNGKCCKNCCSRVANKKCCKKNYNRYDDNILDLETDSESGSEESESSSEESSDDDQFTVDDLDILDASYFKKMPSTNLALRSINNMKDMMKKGGKKNLKKDPAYAEVTKFLDNRKNKEIIIHEGEVVPVPTFNTRECIYVAGPSGSGKSTYLSNYAKEYKNLFPRNNIYLFSRVADDKCLDDLNPTRILMNEEMVEDPINPNELANSLVIFDDTDTIPEGKLKKALIALKNDLLETGRHENVHVAITSHLLTNYRDTRTVLNETHSITLFPCGGSTYAIRYCLKTHCGFDNKEVAKIIKLPSRWVTIKKTFPQAVLYSKGVYLVGQAE